MAPAAFGQGVRRGPVHAEVKSVQGSKAGFVTANWATACVERAVEKATDWMNRNSGEINVHHLAIGQNRWAATVVVWYESKAEGRADSAMEPDAAAPCG